MVKQHSCSYCSDELRRTEAFPLLEGHHLHGFLKRRHVCFLLRVETGEDGGVEAAGACCGGLARAGGEDPSGGSKQTQMSCSHCLSLYRRQSREEQECDSGKQRHTPQPSGQLLRVFVCQLSTGSNQIVLCWLWNWSSHPRVMMMQQSRTHSRRIQAGWRSHDVVNSEAHIRL